MQVDGGAVKLDSQLARVNPHINQRSGVSVRLSIANYETLAGSAVRRALRTNETTAVARPADLGHVVTAGLGKVEFETFEEGREADDFHECCSLFLAGPDGSDVRFADAAGSAMDERQDAKAAKEEGREELATDEPG